MKRVLDAWIWSLAVIIHGPVSVLALAVLVAVWGLAAYRWLWLPESSALILLLSLLWALAQIAIALSVLAAGAARAAEAASVGAVPAGGLGVITIEQKLMARTTLLVAAATVLFLPLTKVVSWVNVHTLEVASFLSFHFQKPVSHVVISEIFWSIEALIGMALAGCFVTFLILLLRSDWRGAWRQRGPILAGCCWRSGFFTTLLSVVFFGGPSYLLMTWHPIVVPGFWDYAQLILRMGGALNLLVLGWLFWLLSLARLSLEG